MILETFETGTTIDVVIHDDAKMIPDPAFARKYTFGLDPQKPGEVDADFQKRKGDFIAQAETEAQILYKGEFVKPATVSNGAKPIVL